MAQIQVIGRITADLELKHSQSGNPYVRFNLAEHIGSGDRARTQFYQVWAWGVDAVRLVDANAHKGSLISISGTLELETYTRQDGVTSDKRLKVSLKDWSFVPVSSRGSMTAASNESATNFPPTAVGEINGDKEPLPG